MYIGKYVISITKQDTNKFYMKPYSKGINIRVGKLWISIRLNIGYWN